MSLAFAKKKRVFLARPAAYLAMYECVSLAITVRYLSEVLYALI